MPATLPGAPPAALMSILGVLRRPATPADRLPVSIPHQPDLYVNDIRFAQAADGIRWYVWVAGSNFRAPADVRRCLAAQMQNFRREEPHISASVRVVALRALQAQLAAERRIDKQPPSEVGVSLTGYAARFGGGGGGASATEIQSRGLWISQGGGTGADPGRTLFAGVLPDGVATVTVHYPAGRIGGFSHRRGPALTVTVPVINNVAVLAVERAGNQATGAVATTWRAQDGTVLKTLHGAL